MVVQPVPVAETVLKQLGHQFFGVAEGGDVVAGIADAVARSKPLLPPSSATVTTAVRFSV